MTFMALLIHCLHQLTRFLEDITRVLRIDTAVLDVSFEGATEAVLRRLEKIMRSEFSSRAASEHSDCHTHIHGLQRKVKNLKEQINGKVSNGMFVVKL